MTANTLIYDCFSGISGDMHIGAMLDLGVPLQHLQDALGQLGMSDEFELAVCRDDKMGITGTRATVKLKTAPGHHRHLSDIRQIIEAANYSPAIESLALDIFLEIAVAEAKIHGTSIEAVHFHEVGATDSIVDIVAAAICLDYLGVDHIYCKTLELGGGMVRCAHGLMPVPAPATAEILNGVPCRYDGVDQEATTPTGAAIVKRMAQGYSTPASFRSQRVGYGVGQKDFEIPNVLRVMLGDSSDVNSNTDAAYEIDQNQEIHCNIDDMPAEAFQPLVEQLLQAGAKDVYLTPIIMKKSRPGTKVSILCTPDLTDRLQGILFTNSTTIGVRVQDVEKRMLPRRVQTLTTSLGDVSVKFVSLPDGKERWKLEYDDVARLARETEQDYLSVHQRLQFEIAQRLED